MTQEEIMNALQQPIPASRLQLRAQSTKNPNFVPVLVYKDARIDNERLTRVLGCFGWQRSHTDIGGVNYCGIGVKNNDTGEWVWKWDAGSESNTEAEKGEASDAFKRAAFQWGIGLELYSMPKIAINLNKLGAKGFYPSDYTLYVAHFKAGDLKNKPAYVKVIYKDNQVAYSWKHEQFDKDNIVMYNEL